MGMDQPNIGGLGRLTTTTTVFSVVSAATAFPPTTMPATVMVCASALIFNILYPYTLCEYMDKFKLIIYHISNKTKGGLINVKLCIFRKKDKGVK